jgi:hypothetical protein
MLVIRHMVDSDLVFLTRSTEPSERRVKFLTAYLNRMDGKLSEARIQEIRNQLTALSVS